jgi:hypothetical protein
MWKLGTLSVAPFDWLEASYFYYRPSDLIWIDGDGIAGHDLDKGFNIKASYQLPFNYMPRLAIGIDDLAGTGYFAREYVVSTYNFNSFKFTLGAGWGKYDKGNGISNPLGLLSDHFKSRSNSETSMGGTLNAGKWFTGDTSLFGGIEWYIPFGRGLRVKIENDPFDYFDLSAGFREDASYIRRKSDSNINLGLSFPLKKYGFIDLSFIKGNTVNLTFTFGATFNDKLVKKDKVKPVVSKNTNEVTFYEDLLFNLNRNQIFLQTASYDEKPKHLDIAIASSKYTNPIRLSSYAAHLASLVIEENEVDINKINITQTMLGMELNKISFLKKDVNDLDNTTPVELIIKRTSIESGNRDDFLRNPFKPKVVFPAIFQSISPNLVNHLGNPQRWYYGGIVLQHQSEVQFTRNLVLSSNLKFTLADNFQDTLTGPGSDFLPHVRTDLMEYLKESDKYISRMQLDYLWSPKKEVYAKFSAGIFEMMYGGFGGEILYKPFDSNFMIGLEAYRVKKRAFDQRTNFLDYETTTGHINLNYHFDDLGLIANLSFGKYLAKDNGYTLDLSRITKSGFRAGIFFSRTNVSAEEFGEGSFDKGFYFQIPFNLFSKNYTQQSFDFKLRPLTRDGGAKLENDKRLIDLINNASQNEITRGWNGFLD